MDFLPCNFFYRVAIVIRDRTGSTSLKYLKEKKFKLTKTPYVKNHPMSMPIFPVS